MLPGGYIAGPRRTRVIIDHRDMAFMASLGMPSDPTLDDLSALNEGYFNYQDAQIDMTTVFGVPALRVRLSTTSGAEISLMGFLNDEAFLLSILPANGETLDENLPASESMLASIRPVKE